MRTNPGPLGQAWSGRPAAPDCPFVTWLLDLDGVVWLTGTPLPRAVDAIARLERAGQRVVFFTNNSGPSMAEHLGHLAAAGIEAAPDDLLTSAHAAASLLPAGSRATVVGGAGVREALERRGIQVVAATEHPDAVVVGRTTEFSYDDLSAASRAIGDGARFLATNTDATLPTAAGPVPGAGAIVAFLSVASGQQPEVAGKPHQAAADLVAELIGTVDVSVGDRPDTDGLFARATKSKFVLVLSGVTKAADLPVDPVPDVVAEDLGAAVDQLIGP
jgi:glycerol 3-phosphatase-2